MQFSSYRQTATYWGSPTPDGSGGHTYASPVALTVRWEQRAMEERSPENQVFVSLAVVYVQEDVDIGGYLYLGTSVASDPTSVSDAFEIKQFRKIPNLRGTQYERRAIL